MNKLRIVDVVRDYLNKKDNKKYTTGELTELITQSYPDFNKESVRRTIRQVANGSDDDKIKITSNKKIKSYFVSDGRYYFETPHGKFDLSVESIDKLFYEYSEHGLNYTQNQIIRKYNFEIWQWNAIKSQLWLFKKSHIFSPYTVENTPKEELGIMIEDKMESLFDDVGYQVEKKYHDTLNKRYLSVIKEFEKEKNSVNRIISELFDLLQDAEIKPIVLKSHTSNKEIINIFIGDIHYGLKNDDDLLQDYSYSVIEEKLQKIAGLVNSIGAESVNIFFVGDFIESFSGTNHPDSWKSLDKDGYGSKLVIKCYKSMVEFISNIANVKNIYGIAGNHDRASSSNKEDTHGFIADIIFEFLKVSFMNKINVEYNDVLISQAFDNINYIITHGHHKISNINPAELILKYGEPNMFNIMVQGHWHERRVKRDSEMFRDLVCPSIMPGNRYSLNSGYSTSPGFLVIKNNGSGKPIVSDYSL